MVATVFKSAGAIAAIASVLIAVIATLAAIDAAVTAAFGAANTVAAIARVEVTIITDLKFFAHHAVTTNSLRTVVAASIDVHAIAVIAGLKARILGLQVITQNTIAAGGDATGAGTSVGIDIVAVITDFAFVDALIAAILQTANLIAAITDL